jgi:hypothetical protein
MKAAHGIGARQARSNSVSTRLTAGIRGALRDIDPVDIIRTAAFSVGSDFGGT